MKIGYLQYAPRFGQPDMNLSHIMEKLADVQADIIVLPELALSGYLFDSQKTAAKYAESVPGISSEAFQNLSDKTATSFIYGCNEIAADNVLYNSAVCIRPHLPLKIYRKIHLFNREKIYFSPGNDDFSLIDINGVKIGILICFDHMFPEAARKLALMGAQIICHPSNLVLKGFAQATTRARSIENGIYWILSNRTGSEQCADESCTYTGLSQITAPDGEILCSSNDFEEELSMIDIDPERARNKAVSERNHLFHDRRTDLY